MQCMANLRSIGQALQNYCTQNNGWLPGSPVTTSAYLVGGWNAYGPTPSTKYKNLADNNPLKTELVPNILGYYDWESPLATVMGYNIDQYGTGPDVFTRLLQINTYGVFICPANQITYASYPSSEIYWPPSPHITNVKFPVPSGPMYMPSYVAAMEFLQSGNIAQANGSYIASVDCTIPSGYVPRIDKVGASARKIFVADGARWSYGSVQPDVSVGTDGDSSAAWADPGPWDAYGRSWDRENVPGGINTSSAVSYSGTQYDPRTWACRHGAEGFQNSNQYLFNALFFDGHVETLGDLEGANPDFWAPKGSEFVAGANGKGSVWPDVLNFFCNGTYPYRVNE